MTDTATPPAATAPADPAVSPHSQGLSGFARVALALARVALGWVFLWAFLDKTFGLGFGTPPDRAWINGGSPTTGYLAGQAEKSGGIADLFVSMSGQAWVDWLFMFGMGGVGIALTLGIGMRLAAVGAVCLMLPLWLTAWPLTSNPVTDHHVIYLVAAIALAAANAGDTLGLGRAWSRSRLVRAVPVLR